MAMIVDRLSWRGQLAVGSVDQLPAAFNLGEGHNTAEPQEEFSGAFGGQAGEVGHFTRGWSRPGQQAHEHQHNSFSGGEASMARIHASILAQNF